MKGEGFLHDSFFKKMDTMMATGVLLLCISVWDRYLNFRSVQNLSMFILLSLPVGGINLS